MSRTYSLFCLNHSPALLIGGEGWPSPEPAIEAVLERRKHAWLMEQHPECDLLVGEYSGGLTEVCCPAKRGVLAHKTHSDPVWIDKEWLILLHAALRAPQDRFISYAVAELTRTHPCWTFERLVQLAPHLGIDPEGHST